MAVKFTNNAKTTLASGINSTVTSATVADGSVFPTLEAGEYFYCTFDDDTNNEIVKVTARSSNTLTIVRGVDNTTARAFLSGDAAELRATSALLTDIQANIAAKSANQTVYNATTASSATAYDIGIDPGVEGNAMVFLNGLMQHHDTFSFSGSTLTLDTAPADGMALEVIVDNLINLQSSNLTVDTFTAADVGGNPQVDFTLSDAPAAETNLIVFVDGVFQANDTYTISNLTLSMTDGVTAGLTVTVYVMNPVNIGAPSDGTVTSSKLSGNITMPGTLTVGAFDVAFDSPTFFVDHTNSRVGLGTASPTVPVDIVGDVKMSAALDVAGAVDLNNLTINTAQGTDGQVLTSTGSGIAWEATSVADGAVTSAKLDTNIAIAGTLTTTGEIVANGGIALGDNDKATFGASDDLQIYHDGANSRIDDVGTGDLVIKASAGIELKSYGTNQTAAYFVGDGAASLYHNGSFKFATTATGIDVTGSVAISGISGTGYQGQRLYGTGTNYNYMQIDNTGGNINFGVESSSGGSLLSGTSAYATVLSSYTNTALHFGTNNALRATLTAAGEFLIGSTESSVYHPLVVYQNATNQHHVGGLSGGLTNNTYYNGSAWTNRNTGAGGAVMQLGTDGSFAFRRATTGASPTLSYSAYIDGSGNVGIGNTNPSGFFSDSYLVVGDGTGTPTSTIYGSSTGTSYLLFADGTTGSAAYAGGIEYSHSSDLLAFFAAGGSRMKIDSAARVIIGPGGALHFSGNTSTGFIYEDGANLQLRSDDAMTFYTYSGSWQVRMTIADGGLISGDFNDTSDVALKENIVAIEDGMSVISQMRPVSFDWRDVIGEDKEGNEVTVPAGKGPTKGLIAQEVEAIDAELVVGEEGEKAINTSGVLAYAIKAIQEQQALIEAQATTITDLTTRLETLENA